MEVGRRSSLPTDMSASLRLPYATKTREGQPASVRCYLPESGLLAGERQHTDGRWHPTFWSLAGSYARNGQPHPYDVTVALSDAAPIDENRVVARVPLRRFLRRSPLA